MIWMKMDVIRTVNQVNVNTQSIQNIATFLQQNTQPASQPTPRKPIPQEEEPQK